MPDIRNKSVMGRNVGVCYHRAGKKKQFWARGPHFIPRDWLGTFVWKEQTWDREIDLRQRWKMASQALMWERKALPRPCPSEAPFTRPAMSVTLRNAGTLLKCREAKLLNPSVASRGDC